MTAHAKQGDWVMVHSVILKPGERAHQVPEDTRGLPLEMFSKGFLVSDACLGDETQVRTVTGRIEQGTLVEINPGYVHGFGEPVKELMTIGLELRKLLLGDGRV